MAKVRSKPASKGRVGRPARDEGEFLDAALVVFSQYGLEGASMDDLAVAAGSTKPTLYARFGSKNELYERIVRREADAFIAHILESYDQDSSLPVYKAAEAGLAAWFGYLDRHPAVLQLLFAPDRSPAAQRIADEVEDRIVAGLSESIERTLQRDNRSAPPQARFLASMVFGATLHATRLNVRADELALDDAVALANSFIYAGYRGVDVKLLGGPPRGKRKSRRGNAD